MNTIIANKEAVMALLGISEETYASTVESFGYGYAWHYTRHDDCNVRFLVRTRSYWNWWKAQWQLRDELFVQEMEGYANTGCEQQLFDMWLDHHSPLNVECYPSSYTLAEAYDLMVEEINQTAKP